MLLMGLPLPAAPLFAQAMRGPEPVKRAPLNQPSTSLSITGLDGAVLTLSPAELKALPRISVNVFNAHMKKNETYSGVRLSDLLAKLHVPLGEELKGKLFMTGVVAKGTDGYQVLYSLAEVDPAMHNGQVMVADAVDGHPLGPNGAFQLINTEDKRPARWVRNLNSISVTTFEMK